MANKKGGRLKTHELRKMPDAEASFADRAAALGGKRAAFLAAYSEVGSIKLAAETSGCDRTLHFYWMKTDPDYPELFREAGKEAFQLLKSRAHERAMEGSDTLMIFLLKAGEPETYRDTHHMYVDGKVRHTGEVDVNHKASDEITVDELPLEMRRQMLELIRKKQEAARIANVEQVVPIGAIVAVETCDRLPLARNGHVECPPDTPKPI